MLAYADLSFVQEIRPMRTFKKIFLHLKPYSIASHCGLWPIMKTHLSAVLFILFCGQPWRKFLKNWTGKLSVRL